MISRWEIPPQWSSSPARRAAGFGLTGKPNWSLSISWVLETLAWWVLEHQMLINWFILQERSTEQCHYPSCPEVSSCWGAQVSLNYHHRNSFVWDCHLCHSLPSLLFFEIVFVILLRVNFSGVKEDKCGEEISTVKLTTCRSPLRRIKKDSVRW